MCYFCEGGDEGGEAQEKKEGEEELEESVLGFPSIKALFVLTTEGRDQGKTGQTTTGGARQGFQVLLRSEVGRTKDAGRRRRGDRTDAADTHGGSRKANTDIQIHEHTHTIHKHICRTHTNTRT